MHDIWNPWHGCKKISEGCENCYMYYLDRYREIDSTQIFKTKTRFNYPLMKNRDGEYKIKTGELLRVCLTSDFFLQEADPWRAEAWDMIRKRSDVKFFLLTKRVERVEKCLPKDWNNGWDNVFFNVSCENQKRADERVPILLDLPFKHKGLMCAPLIGEISLDQFLKSGQIEQVLCGGENYDGKRFCDYDWVKGLRKDCEKYNVTFCFIETGSYFIKDQKKYFMPDKILQSQMAWKSNISFKGKEIQFDLKDSFGQLIPQASLYVPSYNKRCATCGSKLICNGCSHCGKCSE